VYRGFIVKLSKQLDNRWLFGKIDKYYSITELSMSNSERYVYMASVMKALAHPTRLFIVDELEKAPRNVSELTEMVGIDISTISRHLGILKQAGIIGATKRNNQMIYRLLYPCVLDMFSCIKKLKGQAQ
ncbi:MAG: metalloregulator ArsR/SmtB family transcription factor, partial [Candidatus Cloacimonetes bacterium]|nr:metalloregulator ArsR/SmtB family transcription factor [Candidatus Cloacimonadota bacterium]